jgi:hypothetical protein
VSVVVPALPSEAEFAGRGNDTGKALHYKIHDWPLGKWSRLCLRAISAAECDDAMSMK